MSEMPVWVTTGPLSLSHWSTSSSLVVVGVVSTLLVVVAQVVIARITLLVRLFLRLSNLVAGRRLNLL